MERLNFQKRPCPERGVSVVNDCFSAERLLQGVSLQPPVAEGAIVGKSEAILLLKQQILRVANTEVTVLISGESGSGKELVAKSLHDASGRRIGPFVAVNCSAIPSALLESELFGHVKGAFTDAKNASLGLFASAGGGTLFLDEIAEMPRTMQVKLLRVLQERRVRAVGGATELAINVRVVAATNRDLEHEVSVGNFREDLYYRLNVVRILVPPLRDRGNDVLVLASHLMRRWAERMGKGVHRLSSEATQSLLAHDWPGNVRELDNVIQRGVALAQYDEISVLDLGHLGSTILRSPRGATPAELAEPFVVAKAVDSFKDARAESVDESPPPARLDSPTEPPLEVTAEIPQSGGNYRGELADLQQYVRRWLQSRLRGDGASPGELAPTLAELQDIYIVSVVAACRGNKTQAATILGIARRTLYRRLVRCGAHLEKSEARESFFDVADTI